MTMAAEGQPEMSPSVLAMGAASEVLVVEVAEEPTRRLPSQRQLASQLRSILQSSLSQWRPADSSWGWPFQLLAETRTPSRLVA